MWNARSVWPDLAKFRRFGKILHFFGKILHFFGNFVRDHLSIGQNFNLPWQNFYPIGQILFCKQSSYPVTLHWHEQFCRWKRGPKIDVSVTRFNYSWKVLVTDFLTKVATTFWAILKNVTLQIKLLCRDFGQLLGKIGQLLIRTFGHTGHNHAALAWSILNVFGGAFGRIKFFFLSVWPDGYITFQSWVIYNNDNLPSNSTKMAKLVQKFAKY